MATIKSIEEKAKAYDEALAWMRDLYPTMEGAMKEDAEHYFPELKESEGEKIRKELIDIVAKSPITFAFEDKNKVLSWLEKQGEQKPQEKSALEAAKEEKIDNANKAEPKFKAGDWVVCGQYGAPCQIESIKNGRYYFTSGIGIPVENVNIDYHLWTIQDAKDGDVLSYRNGQWIFIYKEKIDDSSFDYHILYSTTHQDLTINDAGFTLLSDAITSATKEQRDLLFQKMKEAGYEWDADKKELRKIEQKPILDVKIPFGAKDSELEEVSYSIPNGYHAEIEDSEVVIKKGEQKPAEWSEEDYNEIETIACHLDNINNEGMAEVLRSIRDKYYHQSSWRPSDEQMKALSIVTCGVDDPLFSLYQDLKKLREE